jgi:hypothetical protein
VWIGNDDALGAVLAATAVDGVTMTPVDVFAGLYGNAIGALVTNTTADIVLVNLPYSTSIPFATSVPPLVHIPGLGTIPLAADTGPLGPNDRVTLYGGALVAQGYGLPGGPPLQDNLNLLTGEPGYVLRAAEVQAINDRIDAFNQVIADTAANFGLPVFDANALLAGIASGAALPLFGGIELSADFLLGGIYSYDGIHPQNIGYAVLANDLIQFINAEFGASIPQVNMAEVLYEGDWQDPGISPAKAHEVVMSHEAFEQLYKVLGPKIQQAPRIRRPNTPQQPGVVVPDIRRVARP